jgi:uroporphyrinogen decarboxylase
VYDVLLVRAPGGDDRDADELRRRGVSVVEDPYLTVAACQDTGASDRAEHVLQAISDSADWLVVTSQAALRALAQLVGDDRLRVSILTGRERGLRFATVGETTANALRFWGAGDVLRPSVSTAAALREELAKDAPATIVAPQGSQAMKGLSGGLRSMGWVVDEVVVYETTTVGHRPVTADRLAAGDFAAVVFRSPTAVRAAASFVPLFPPTTVAVCGGPTTAAEVERLGIGRVAVSSGPTPEEVADTVVEILAGLSSEEERA